MTTSPEQLTELSFFSEPGIYEIETHEGPVYDVDVPEDLNDAGVMLISREAGKVDDRDGRSLLQILELAARVGERAYFLVKAGEGYKEVRSKPVTAITRVG